MDKFKEKINTKKIPEWNKKRNKKTKNLLDDQL